MLVCLREAMSIKFLCDKIFKDRAKIDVRIRTEQSGLYVSPVHSSKQPYIVEEEFEQISLLVQKQRYSRFLDIVCRDSHPSIPEP